VDTVKVKTVFALLSYAYKICNLSQPKPGAIFQAGDQNIVPISPKKLEANRRNAVKSRGPATPRGRAVSSQNARKHKLLPFENPALPAQLTAQYYGYFMPANKNERRLVDRVIHSDRLRRYFLSLEIRVRAKEIADTETRSMPAALASASLRLMTVPYHLDVADCTYHNTIRQLEEMRSKAA
jgi:hypothetical protein